MPRIFFRNKFSIFQEASQEKYWCLHNYLMAENTAKDYRNKLTLIRGDSLLIVHCDNLGDKHYLEINLLND